MMNALPSLHPKNTCPGSKTIFSFASGSPAPPPSYENLTFLHNPHQNLFFELASGFYPVHAKICVLKGTHKQFFWSPFSVLQILAIWASLKF